VEEGAWWASVDLAPVVTNWHALALLEVWADTLLLWAVQIAILFQDALTSVVVELGTSWAHNLVLEVVDWHAFAVFKVGSHTVGFKALDVTVILSNALTRHAIEPGTVRTFAKFASHWHAFAFIGVDSPSLFAMQHILAVINDNAAAEISVKDGTLGAISLGHGAQIFHASAVNDIKSLTLWAFPVAVVVWHALASFRIEDTP
jgi:hypothetical protein